jgi:hypothetical protein
MKEIATVPWSRDTKVCKAQSLHQPVQPLVHGRAQRRRRLLRRGRRRRRSLLFRPLPLHLLHPAVAAARDPLTDGAERLRACAGLRPAAARRRAPQPGLGGRRGRCTGSAGGGVSCWAKVLGVLDRPMTALVILSSTSLRPTSQTPSHHTPPPPARLGPPKPELRPPKNSMGGGDQLRR